MSGAPTLSDIFLTIRYIRYDPINSLRPDIFCTTYSVYIYSTTRIISLTHISHGRARSFGNEQWAAALVLWEHMGNYWDISPRLN